MDKLFNFLLILALLGYHSNDNLPDSDRAKTIRLAVWPRIQSKLKEKALKINRGIYIRIFKEERELEIWVRSGPHYQFFKSYNICAYSGGLGTKIRSGDYKSPEGFYTIQPKQLNPVSSYHLSINIGYPNKLETLKGYTGDQIMIHGICASNGCYAMTDDGIDEIYTTAYRAFESGQQKIQLDIFPFRMDGPHMKSYSKSPFLPFWKTLKPGYDLFQKNQVPAVPTIRSTGYAFGNGR